MAPQAVAHAVIGWCICDTTGKCGRLLLPGMRGTAHCRPQQTHGHHSRRGSRVGEEAEQLGEQQQGGGDEIEQLKQQQGGEDADVLGGYASDAVRPRERARRERERETSHYGDPRATYKDLPRRKTNPRTRLQHHGGISVGSTKAAELFERIYGMARLVGRWAAENNASYTIFCGSLLGAMRDGAIIPHDDDIDLLMAKADFERLRALKPIKGKYFRMFGSFFCINHMSRDWIQLFPATLGKNSNPASCLDAGVDIWSTASNHKDMRFYIKNNVRGFWSEYLKEKKKVHIKGNNNFFDLDNHRGSLVLRSFGPLELLSLSDSAAVLYLCEEFGCDHIRQGFYRDAAATRAASHNPGDMALCGHSCTAVVEILGIGCDFTWDSGCHNNTPPPGHTNASTGYDLCPSICSHSGSSFEPWPLSLGLPSTPT